MVGHAMPGVRHRCYHHYCKVLLIGRQPPIATLYYWDVEYLLLRAGCERMTMKGEGRRGVPSYPLCKYESYKNEQHFTITKVYLSTPFREIIDVYSENHTKPINTLCGHNTEL
jgi:hypothetical protein